MRIRKHVFIVTAKRNIGGKINESTELSIVKSMLDIAKKNLNGKVNKKTKKSLMDEILIQNKSKAPSEIQIIKAGFFGGEGISVSVEGNNPFSPGINKILEAFKNQFGIEVKGTPSIDFFKVSRVLKTGR